MKYAISKSFSFEAAHRLHKMPEDHKCRHLHGHSYNATITLKSHSLNEYGMVIDYNDLNVIKDWIDDNLDHSVLVALSDLNLSTALRKLDAYKIYKMSIEQTTCELMAPYLGIRFSSLLAEKSLNMEITVTLSETSKTSCTV